MIDQESLPREKLTEQSATADAGPILAFRASMALQRPALLSLVARRQKGEAMASEQKPPGDPRASRFYRTLYAVCGGVGCFLGVWFEPRLTGWRDPNSPAPFSALGGMGIGFAVAEIISGLVTKSPPSG